MRSRFLLLLVFLSAAGVAAAQGVSEQMIKAFAESYGAESSKDYDKAISALKLLNAETSYETNLRLGWLYYSKKEYVQSVKYYQTAIKLKPKSIEAMLGYVNPEAALQNWNNVFDTYKKILALDPHHSLANYRIGLMYFYRKDYASAQVHLQNVLDLYPFDYDSMLLMAQTKIAAGKLTEGKALYERVLLYNPSDTTAKKALEKL